VTKAHYTSAGEVGSGDISTDVFLEFQDERYSQMLYLIDYIAYGLHLEFKTKITKECIQTLSKSILLMPRSAFCVWL
jgi:hypothetical protein